MATAHSGGVERHLGFELDVQLHVGPNNDVQSGRIYARGTGRKGDTPYSSYDYMAYIVTNTTDQLKSGGTTPGSRPPAALQYPRLPAFAQVALYQHGYSDGARAWTSRVLDVRRTGVTTSAATKSFRRTVQSSWFVTYPVA